MINEKLIMSTSQTKDITNTFRGGWGWWGGRGRGGRWGGAAAATATRWGAGLFLLLLGLLFLALLSFLCCEEYMNPWSGHFLTK